MPNILELSGFVLFFSVSLSYCTSLNWSQVKPKICISSENYTRDISAGKIKMFLGIKVFDLQDINEHDMEFGLQVNRYELWFDPTLTLGGGHPSTNSESVTVPEDFTDCIWKPDTVFYNTKAEMVVPTGTPTSFVKLLPGGFLFRYSRHRLIVSCGMDFKMYPMDSHFCVLHQRLLVNTVEEVDLSWIGSPGTPPTFKTRRGVELVGGIRPLKFHVMQPVEAKVDKNHAEGTFTEMYANFTFHRRVTACLVNTYIPSFLVTAMSWVSFWLDVNAVPGRVTLGVTALLTLVTTIVQARSNLPSLDYMTAMDNWLFGCLVMVFLSVVEFTIANMNRRIGKCKNKPEPVERAPSTLSKEAWNKSDPATRDSVSRSSVQVLQAVIDNRDNVFDRGARVLFPVSALVLLIAYWTYYASMIV